ncbi:putative HTH-type transcriptional regulator YdcH [Nocardia seriolae]|uniref:HTH-type transcriptional regulator YdcH n=2 Tax=Nocardia seriolae TaxID=37332 RepID=A0ABC8AJZ0_9NOCA|nr:putative HTH-type transcriptional regulator YdcH [Nocardia seriolae]BEK84597.1 MarR family transcriptional regulator [Nocardia seriolae]BEK92553.1 MarR family transcriptional regulator [Nocardia seriolae]GEM24900.1 MarR family transcriptional regulator [Nocardia seriolae NBRC 15557]
MAEKPRGPLMSPGFWLHNAALEWRATLERNLRPLGLTPTQFNLLASAGWLGRAGELPTQQQVADMSGSDRMMASKVIRGLEERGLLIRRPDPADARVLRVELTAAGRELASKGVRTAVDTDAQLFGADGDLLREHLKPIAAHRLPG